MTSNQIERACCHKFGICCHRWNGLTDNTQQTPYTWFTALGYGLFRAVHEVMISPCNLKNLMIAWRGQLKTQTVTRLTSRLYFACGVSVECDYLAERSITPYPTLLSQEPIASRSRPSLSLRHMLTIDSFGSCASLSLLQRCLRIEASG